MIGRSWRGKVPVMHADGFQAHLLATGVADYLQQAGCSSIQIWRNDMGEWAHFLLLSNWKDLATIRAFVGDTPEKAILYPGDDQFELVPDTVVSHYEVLDLTLTTAK